MIDCRVDLLIGESAAVLAARANGHISLHRLLVRADRNLYALTVNGIQSGVDLFTLIRSRLELSDLAPDVETTDDDEERS